MLQNVQNRHRVEVLTIFPYADDVMKMCGKLGYFVGFFLFRCSSKPEWDIAISDLDLLCDLVTLTLKRNTY